MAQTKAGQEMPRGKKFTAEQIIGKPRPAVIVQADHLDTGLPQVVVAMISEAAIDRVIGHLATDAIDVALRATLALG